MRKKYLFENFKMTTDYRQYNNFVPDFHNRPRSVIKHCLEWKANGQKYAKKDVCCTNEINGKFEVKGMGKVHTIDFGKKSLMYMAEMKNAVQLGSLSII